MSGKTKKENRIIIRYEYRHNLGIAVASVEIKMRKLKTDKMV